MSGRRILVAGGAGFIGSAFVRFALREAPEVRVLTFDALTYAGHRANLDDLPDASRHELVEGDIADPAALRSAMEAFEPTEVVNLAAETHVDQSLLAPARFVRTNVVGTQVLLDACRESGVRLLHVSTDEVYGTIPPPERAARDRALAPSSPYAASKAAADLLALAHAVSYDQDVLVTRCTNNYGPRQLPEKLIPLMTLRALAGKTLPVYGDGRQIRDWIHVEDHVAGLWAALFRGVPGRVYHFAAGDARENLHVVERILEAAGAPAAGIEHVTDRPGHDRRYALDDASTRAELEWRPGWTFEAGLRATIRWYRDNAAWCRATASAPLQAFLDRNYAKRDP